ncbi:MAG: NADH-quinone oxidoreductase subunit N [Bacteroidales bacterium]|nr:NADH-quinone oxidoreductase subunit N [Bacteroidales bacterium]MDE7072276.1 NADH-quinone oxidoreductase subunit N [Bacteroidales bacterium]
MDFSNFLILRDELSLVFLILCLLMFDLFASASGRRLFQPVACVLLLLQILFTAFFSGDSAEAFGGMYTTSPLATMVKIFMSIGTLLVFLFSKTWIENDHEIAKGEYYYLTLSTLLGMYFMISSGHFLLFFIGIELAAIPLACLVAFDKHKPASAEAGAKFILNAAFASGISLFGISLLYGGCGTLYFTDMAAVLNPANLLQTAGMIFFATGLFFKMSLVPYHSWTADVYQGAPANVGAYLSVVSKMAAAVSLFLIFVKVFGAMAQNWKPIFYALIVLSITIANLFAIKQKDIKRFLAYSSISQAGYVVLGVITATAQGLTGLIYYLFVYMLANLAAFGIAAIVERQSGDARISGYNGLYKTNPKLSVLMMFALFSLAGIPPFAGFFSKFFIFAAAIQEGWYILVLIALLNTVISLYYYLLIVRAMFITPNDNPLPAFKSDTASRIAMTVCFIGIVLAGLASCIYNRIGMISDSSFNAPVAAIHVEEIQVNTALPADTVSDAFSGASQLHEVQN